MSVEGCPQGLASGLLRSFVDASHLERLIDFYDEFSVPPQKNSLVGELQDLPVIGSNHRHPVLEHTQVVNELVANCPRLNNRDDAAPEVARLRRLGGLPPVLMMQDLSGHKGAKHVLFGCHHRFQRPIADIRDLESVGNGKRGPFDVGTRWCRHHEHPDDNCYSDRTSHERLPGYVSPLPVLCGLYDTWIVYGDGSIEHKGTYVRLIVRVARVADVNGRE